MIRKRILVALVILVAFAVPSGTSQTAPNSGSVAARSPEIESLLQQFSGEFLPCANLQETIRFPKSAEYYWAWGSLVIAVGQDVAFIVTAGHSEVVTKVVKAVDLTTAAVDTAKATMATIDGQSGAVGEWALGRAADVTIHGVERFVKAGVPGLRTGVRVYGVFKAHEQEAVRVQELIDRQQDVQEFAAQVAPVVAGIQRMIDSLPLNAARHEYSSLLKLMLQRRAEIAIYRQLTRDKFVGSAGQALDLCIDNAIPGVTNPTMNAGFVQAVEGYIDGTSITSDFDRSIDEEIRRRIGSIPRTNIADVRRACSAQLGESDTRRDLLGHHGGSFTCAPPFAPAYRELASAVGSPPPRACAGGIELALLIDSSGSMMDNDPRGLRRSAAELVIDRSPVWTRFSVVDFDSGARALSTRSTNRTAVSAAISRIDSQGGTNIEAALKTSFEVLRHGSGTRAAVLFTDGRSDRRGGVQPYVDAGIPVHVVGLGRGVDAGFLTRLASTTGGVYLQAARATDLTAAFDQVLADLACEGTVTSYRAMIQQGEVLEQAFTVDELIDRLVARLTWGGSRLELELIDPSGSVVGQTIGSGSTYRIVAIDAPRSGAWTARITGAEVDPGGESFLLRAGGPSDLTISMELADPRDPTLLKLKLDSPLSGFKVNKVWSRIKSPKGRTEAGPTPSAASSSEWEVSVPLSEPGVYTVTAGLTGSAASGGDWSREVTRTVVAGPDVVPWRGKIVRVEGGYVTINRGSRHGVRAGTHVVLSPGVSPAGSGVVVSIEYSTSVVEVQELLGGSVPHDGMRIELDRADWMADRP